MVKSIVVLSGGMDSTTVLHRVVKELEKDSEVHAINIGYGQKHKKEIKMAKIQADGLNVPIVFLDIPQIKDILGGSALTDNIDVPYGHYTEESMKLTVVPNRNMILLSLAIGYAVSIGASRVYYGAHSGDHAIYPDCRAIFVRTMTEVAKVANHMPVYIIAPYLNQDKGDIVIDGLRLGVDYKKTWTCYEGKVEPCGKCGCCVERAEAFEKAGAKDPLLR